MFIRLRHALFLTLAEVVFFGIFRLLLVKRRSRFIADTIFSRAALTHRSLQQVFR